MDQHMHDTAAKLRERMDATNAVLVRRLETHGPLHDEALDFFVPVPADAIAEAVDVIAAAGASAAAAGDHKSAIFLAATIEPLVRSLLKALGETFSDETIEGVEDPFTE